MTFNSKGVESKKSPKKAERWNNVRFINYELSQEETLSCKTWNVTLEELDKALSALFDDGYRLSCKFDEYGQCYGAFLNAPASGSVNSGFCLSGRGSTPVKAVKQLLYKHFHILDQHWEQWAEAMGGKIIDD